MKFLFAENGQQFYYGLVSDVYSSHLYVTVAELASTCKAHVQLVV